MSRQVKLLEDDVLSLKRQLVQANSRIVELEAEVKRLKEALRPFAQFGRHIPSNWPCDCIPFVESIVSNGQESDVRVNYHPAVVTGYPTVGDYRNASSALGSDKAVKALEENT